MTENRKPVGVSVDEAGDNVRWRQMIQCDDPCTEQLKDKTLRAETFNESNVYKNQL